MSLLAAVSAIIVTIGLLSGSGSPSGASTGQPGVTLATQVSSGDASCDPPRGQSAQSAGPVEVESAGGEGSAGLKLLEMLGEGAFHFGEDEGLGWFLSVIGGEQPSLDPAKIDEQFDQVNAKLDALSQQQYDDCTAVLLRLSELQTGVDRDAYDNLVTPMAVQIGQVKTYNQDYETIVTALGQNGGHVNDLSSSLKDDMKEMLSGGQAGIRNIVNTMDTLEAGDQPGAKAMVSFYSQILTDELHYDPYQTHVFPAEFVNAAAAQQGYYAAILERAVYLYANVAHLDFTDGDYTHEADPDGVASMVNLAQKDIQSWTVSFADGPAGDGTASWVSQGKNQGIGSIPDHTVLDYRSRSRPLLWTDAPVGLHGDPASPAPYYCGTTAAYCYADQYNGAGQVASTALVPSSPDPIADMIANENYGGLSGWRVPTSADWNAVESGATGGLTAWGAAHQLGGIFANAKFTSHYGGSDQTLTTIAPVLVNTATTANPAYGVLSSTDPAANTLTLEKPALPQSNSDAAGRLFLTTDYQPTTPPKPFTDTSTSASKTASAPAPVSAGRSGSVGSRSATTSAVLTSADTPSPTQWFTPQACSASNVYTVPAGVGSVRITALGGAGAPGEVLNQPSSPGGVGGVVTETVPVTAGTNLYVQVGGAGSAGGSRAGGIGGGGTGGNTHSEKTTSHDYSGGGGGASGVSTTPDCSHWLVVAGGGGGGGAGLEANGHDPQLNGGRGGNGCAGTTMNCQTATDGSQSSGYPLSGGRAGGSAPNNRGGDVGRDPSGRSSGSAGNSGSTMQGGDGGTNQSSYLGGGGGGGGGGYFGGGGGGGSGWNAAGGGGGGGASFAIPGATSVTYGLGSAGQNGSVTITPIAKPSLPIDLSVSPTELAWDQPLPVSFTATVPVDATGNIDFYVSGYDKPAGTAPIRHGVAVLSSMRLAPMVGTDSVHVSYAGDAHYLPTTSNDVPFVVTKQTPTMQLTVSGTVLKKGQEPTSLVVQMSPYAAGSVEFYDDINGGCEGKTGAGAACERIGTAPLGANYHGYATLTTLTAPLQPGKNSLYATYAGDSQYGAFSEFNPSSSNVVTVTVAS